MIAKIIDFFKGFMHHKNSSGCIAKCFAKHKSTLVISEIVDPVNQERAVEFVKQACSKKNFSSSEKAEFFNLKMLDWAENNGVKLSDCALNCLRETALASVKASELDGDLA